MLRERFVPGDLTITTAHTFLSIHMYHERFYLVPQEKDEVYLIVEVHDKRDRWQECTVLTRHGLFLCSSDFLSRTP